MGLDVQAIHKKDRRLNDVLTSPGRNGYMVYLVETKRLGVPQSEVAERMVTKVKTTGLRYFVMVTIHNR